jgi:hypothetical protein
MRQILADLVFRGAYQECAHNAQEISGLAAELVFREIPGKAVQRRRDTQWLRGPCLCMASLEAIAGSVVRVLHPPSGLRLFPPRRLTLRLAA